MYQLHIANKNYSSWSLRPWVLMKALDVPFEESLVGWQAFLDSQGERWISRKPFTGAAYSDFTDSGLIAKK